MKTDEEQIQRWLSLSVEELQTEIKTRHPIVDGDEGGKQTRLSQILEKWNSISNATRSEIDQKLCKDLNYCEISKHELKTNLVYALAGCITVDFGAISVPILLIAVLLLKLGVLDELCGCRKQEVG